MHVSWPSSPLAPHSPFVLSILNLRAALGTNWLVLKISVLPPKLSRQSNSRTSNSGFLINTFGSQQLQRQLCHLEGKKPVPLSHWPLSLLRF